MVLVTDKKYYMEKDLKQNLDFLIKRMNNKWDNALIIDGDERSGKSTLGRQIGYYMACEMNLPFSLENIFFDPNGMFDFATKNNRQIIIWDEAAMGGATDDRFKEIQQLIIKMLITCGKYNHTYIFIIPKIRKLANYIAEDRSLALIRVFAINNFDRGHFKSYSRKKKDLLSQWERKNWNKFVCPDFRGKFFSYEGTEREIFDIRNYELKKSRAIRNLNVNNRTNLMWKSYFKILVDYCKKNKFIMKKDIAKMINRESTFLNQLSSLNVDNIIKK